MARMRTYFQVSSLLDEVLERGADGAGIEAGAEVQQARSFPDTTLGGRAEIEQQRMCGVFGGDRLQGTGNAVEDDGEFVVEVMRGGGSYGAGAMGIGKFFHSRMLPRGQADQTSENVYQIESERNCATKIAVNAS